MSELIPLEELPRWVPGLLDLDSQGLGWNGVRVREFLYSGLDVPVPGIQDFLVVVYTAGATSMNRRCGGSWQSDYVSAGSVSLLTRAAPSHWRWSEAIRTCHVYLSPSEVAKVASEVFEREVQEVSFRDVLRVEDPLLENIAARLSEEARCGGLGGRLYAEALRNQTCVHLLRHYADVEFSHIRSHGGLSAHQCQLLRQFIEESLHVDISLGELASIAGLSTFHFSRKFRTTFGCPPYSYILQQRLERAKRQLSDRRTPIKVVAINCGFSDQSHMNRVFRKFLDVTPAEYRRLSA